MYIFYSSPKCFYDWKKTVFRRKLCLEVKKWAFLQVEILGWFFLTFQSSSLSRMSSCTNFSFPAFSEVKWLLKWNGANLRTECGHYHLLLMYMFMCVFLCYWKCSILSPQWVFSLYFFDLSNKIQTSTRWLLLTDWQVGWPYHSS